MSEVLEPKSVAELTDAVANANADATPLSIIGQGSRYPIAGRGVSCRALNGLRFFDPQDMVVGVEAGMSFAELQATLAKENMLLPLNPFYAQTTVGSVVACNDIGPNRMFSGGLRDHIIGIEYVSGTGKLVKAGGKVVKNVTGYDLGKMLLGSLGALGAISAINFKVTPMTTSPSVAVASFSGLEWIKRCLEIHDSKLPIEWAQVTRERDDWTLSIGYSGNDSRRKRIASVLSGISNAFEHVAESDLANERPEIKMRNTGFIDARFPEIASSDLHLHLCLNTSSCLDENFMRELQKAGVDLLVHPYGADIHLVAATLSVDDQKAIVTKINAMLKGHYLRILRASEEVTREWGRFYPQSKESTIVQSLKRGLDPSNIFSSVFILG